MNFLRRINMEQYVEAFLRDNISGELLIDLSDQDLEELGVNSNFHRFKITFCFKREVSGRPIKCPPEMVASMLEGDANLKKYGSSILRNGVDGEMLLQCDNDLVLEELGITSKLNYKKIATLIKSFIAKR